MIRDLGTIRGWVLDVDGCLVRTKRAGGHGGVAIEGAIDFMRAILSAGHRVVVCTNASERPPAVYAAHLRELGLPVSTESFFTAGSAVASHIVAHHPGARVLAIGGDGLTVPLAEAGAEVLGPEDGSTADAVVVGAARTYGAAELSAGALAVDGGAAFYTTVASPWFHGGSGRSLAVSSAVAASISWATGRTPIVGGKPSAVLADSLLRVLGLRPEHVAVVGDAPAEIQLARAMGATAITVLSGALTAEDLTGSTAPQDTPDAVFSDVGELFRTLPLFTETTTEHDQQGAHE